MMDISELLFITDLDGTLLPNSKIISETDLNEISQYRKKGGLFSIATGRTIQSAKPYYKSLDIDIPVILYNGAVIYSPKDEKILYTRTLTADMKNIVMEVLEKFDFAGCEILKSDGVYVVRNNEYEQEHINICRAEPVFCNIYDMECESWLKVLFAMPAEKSDEVWNFVSSLENSSDFIRSSDTFIELLPHNVSKGDALKKYSDITGINISYIISAGDYDNDIEMLECADIGIAPANACKKALESADFISEKSCEDNFIADAVKYIFTEVI
jgi:hypothetical protein